MVIWRSGYRNYSSQYFSRYLKDRMPSMDTLLSIANLGQRAYGRWLFQRLISGIMMVAGLTFVIAIMVSALLIGGLVAAYYTLLYYGIGQLMAVSIIAVLATSAIAALVILTLSCLHQLRQIPRKLFRQSPLTSRAMDTLDAFTDGLMAE